MRFRVEEMHLTQVGLRRVPYDPRTMLDRPTRVGVAFYA